jgi:hypothetical protein
MENYDYIAKHYWGICYYLNSKFHRLDGPAIENVNGTKEWYQNGKRHRVDGPAVEEYDGSKEWFQNGKLHRLNGPAFEGVNGYKEWWFEGKQIYCNSQEEFERLIKLRLFW